MGHLTLNQKQEGLRPFTKPGLIQQASSKIVTCSHHITSLMRRIDK